MSFFVMLTSSVILKNKQKKQTSSDSSLHVKKFNTILKKQINPYNFHATPYLFFIRYAARHPKYKIA
jgi:hypothetical protein